MAIDYEKSLTEDLDKLQRVHSMENIVAALIDKWGLEYVLQLIKLNMLKAIPNYEYAVQQLEDIDELTEEQK